jgi:hypothetical protein
MRWHEREQAGHERDQERQASPEQYGIRVGSSVRLVIACRHPQVRTISTVPLTGTR